MAEYDFTLRFDIASFEREPESLVDQLYEAGCDDAIIGFGRQGRIALNFTREARSATEAISSALRDVPLLPAKCDRRLQAQGRAATLPVAAHLECGPAARGIPSRAHSAGA